MMQKIRNLAGIVLIIVGIGLLLFPEISSLILNIKSEQTVSELKESMKRIIKTIQIHYMRNLLIITRRFIEKDRQDLEMSGVIRQHRSVLKKRMTLLDM